jgi:hypothetical protein
MSRDDEKIKNLIFVSLYPPEYSRSGVFYSGYPSKKIYVEFSASPRQIIRQIGNLNNSYSFSDSIIYVMSPSHVLAIYFKLFSKFKVVLDAGWPLSDSKPRAKLKHLFTLDLLKNTTYDYLSFHLVDRIIFETEQQRNFSRKKFLLRSDKCHSIPTGFNEVEYTSAISNSRMPTELQYLMKSGQEFILFRGKNNRESGVEKIIDAARILRENFIFLVVSNSELTNVPANVIQINRFLSKEELVWIYRHASFVLGQFGSNSRLSRTVPHKFFESAYFAKCYVTPRNIGLRGLADEKNVCFTLTSGSTDIASTLNKLTKNQDQAIFLSKNLKKSYELAWSQTKISKAVNEVIELL